MSLDWSRKLGDYRVAMESVTNEHTDTAYQAQTSATARSGNFGPNYCVLLLAGLAALDFAAVRNRTNPFT